MSIGVGYNAFWNVLGSTLPLLAGVVAIPLLLHGLGNTRLGVFTLALGLIGFSGIFCLLIQQQKYLEVHWVNL